MSSERKILANRENARKSRGPRTEAGKANSAGNAKRHGLLARNLLLDRESATRFHEVVTGLHQEFQPATPAETAAVESMAWSRWRQMRLWTLEQAAINAEIQKLAATPNPVLPGTDESCARAAQAFGSLGDRSNTLSLINRYETSYDRQFTRAFRRFLAIRQAHEKANKQEISKRSHQVIENKGPAPESDPTATLV